MNKRNYTYEVTYINHTSNRECKKMFVAYTMLEAITNFNNYRGGSDNCHYTITKVELKND